MISLAILFHNFLCALDVREKNSWIFVICNHHYASTNKQSKIGRFEVCAFILRLNLTYLYSPKKERLKTI